MEVSGGPRRLAAAGFAGFTVFDAAFADDGAHVAGRGDTKGFVNEVDNECGEFGGVADGGGPNNGHAEVSGFGLELVIEVPNDLHVVGDESDGGDEEVGFAALVEKVGVIQDVGFQPGDFTVAGGGLPDHVVVGDAEVTSDKPGGFTNLLGVEVAVGVGAGALVGDDRDGVGGEDESDIVAAYPLVSVLLVGVADGVGAGFDKCGVVEELPQPIEINGVFVVLCQVVAHFLDVFPVLAAAGIPAPGGGGENCDVAVPVFGEFEGNVVGVGVPVAVAEVDGQAAAPAAEFGLDVGDDFPVAVVEGAVAIEMMVVDRDLIKAGCRYSPPPGDVFQERADVFGFFRSAEA